jgi:hypothetical protein
MDKIAKAVFVEILGIYIRRKRICIWHQDDRLAAERVQYMCMYLYTEKALYEIRICMQT